MGRCFFLVRGAWSPRPIARSRGLLRACASVPCDPALYPEEARGQRHQQQLVGGLTGKRCGVRAHKRRRVTVAFLHVCPFTATEIYCSAACSNVEKRWKFCRGAETGVNIVKLCQGALALWTLVRSVRHSRLATLCTSENVGGLLANV